MADESVNVKQDIGGDRIIDGESVTGHPDGTSFRQRVQISGASLAEVAPVKAVEPTNDSYAIVTRPVANAVPPSVYISKHLTDDGTGSGGNNANGNYAVKTRFWRGPGAGKLWVIRTLIVGIQDVGTFDSGKYGNNITLTNGIGLEVWNGSTVDLDLMDGDTVLVNAGWSTFAYETSLSNYGTGNETLSVRWDLTQGGRALIIDGDATQVLAATFEDDLTGLVDHHFFINGYEIDA